jgi:hypothetical protein
VHQIGVRDLPWLEALRERVGGADVLTAAFSRVAWM